MTNRPQYDNGWWGFILGSPYFNDQFGSTATTNPATGVTTIGLSSSEQSAGTGLGTAGIMIGCMVAPWVNEKYGRKKSFLLLAAIGIIGSLIQALSTIGTQYWVLIAGKVVLNVSVGIASAVIGVYLSECAPASLRGALMSNYNIVQVRPHPMTLLTSRTSGMSLPPVPSTAWSTRQT